LNLFGDTLCWVSGVESGRLAMSPRPSGGAHLAPVLAGWRAQGVDLVVSLLTSEDASQLDLAAEGVTCAAVGLAYQWLPMQEHSVPALDDDFAGALALVVRTLHEGRSVVVHCRAGLGRTGLFCACVMHRLGNREPNVFAGLTKDRGLRVPDNTLQIEWFRTFAETNGGAA
jgi:protein tyrosine phosphatase (PTP) superfamily phosphohydrolase (DUF442 family)